MPLVAYHAMSNPALARLGLAGCSSPAARRRSVAAPRLPAARRAIVVASANTFGQVFRVTTFGESHGGGVGCVVDGVPPRMPLTQADLQARCWRLAFPFIFVAVAMHLGSVSHSKGRVGLCAFTELLASSSHPNNLFS